MRARNKVPDLADRRKAARIRAARKLNEIEQCEVQMNNRYIKSSSNQSESKVQYFNGAKRKRSPSIATEDEDTIIEKTPSPTPELNHYLRVMTLAKKRKLIEEDAPVHLYDISAFVKAHNS